MTPGWLVTDIAAALDPPLRNAPGARSATNLLAVVAQFLLEVSPRYHPRDLDDDGHQETMCNVFLSDVTAALGCPVPRGDARKWLRANDQIDWLRSDAAVLAGWRETTAQTGAARAFVGFPTVVTFKAPSGSGHVALLVPTPPGRTGAYVAQAGRRCSSRLSLAGGFGDLPVQFWTHA